MVYCVAKGRGRCGGVEPGPVEEVRTTASAQNFVGDTTDTPLMGVLKVTSSIRSGSLSVCSDPEPHVRAEDDSFAAWVSPHILSMRLLAGRLEHEDPDDLVQEAIIQAWKKRHLYDAARGSPQTWLLAVLVGRARTRSRRRRWRLAAHPRVDRASTDDGSSTAVESLALRAAVEQLPKRQRLAVECFYYLDLSIHEAAAALHCTPGTVKSNLAMARRSLKKILETAEE